MAFIKSLLIASVATLAVAAPGYEYGSAPAKAVEQPAYAAPAVQAPAYTAPKPAVKEPEVYEAPKPAVKEPEKYEAPKPAVKEPEKYAAPTKKAVKQPEYKVDPVKEEAVKAPAYVAEPAVADPAMVQTVVIEQAVAAPAVVEPAVAAPVEEAAPTTEIDVSSQENNAHCGENQQLSCCNSGEELIGANCLSIPIRKYQKSLRSSIQPCMMLTQNTTVAIPIGQACGSNVAACCQTGNAVGNLINIELNCLAIPL